MLIQGYLWRFFLALLFAFIGWLLSTQPKQLKRLVGLLASFGLARDETDADVEAAGAVIVKIFYGLSLLALIWLGYFFYHHHRGLKAESYPGLEKVTPYQPATEAPLPGTPYHRALPQPPRGGGSAPGEGTSSGP
ncbi:MAG TPA: hypothetical protein EYP85_01895 [Armatimonadetes bacterium]|nr:hypothetical protein [Armatimonadota bacterium]